MERKRKRGRGGGGYTKGNRKGMRKNGVLGEEGKKEKKFKFEEVEEGGGRRGKRKSQREAMKGERKDRQVGKKRGQR